MDVGNRFSHAGVGATLRSGLNDTVVLASRFYDTASFTHVMADGLFDIDVFASLDRPDSCQRMPVIRGRNTDDMNAFVFEALSHVCVNRWSFTGFLFDFIRTIVDHRLVNVDQCSDLAIFAFAKSADMRSSTPSYSHYRHS